MKSPARPFAVSALAAAAVVALPLLAGGSAAAETYKPAGT